MSKVIRNSMVGITLAAAATSVAVLIATASPAMADVQILEVLDFTFYNFVDDLSPYLSTPSIPSPITIGQVYVQMLWDKTTNTFSDPLLLATNVPFTQPLSELSGTPVNGFTIGTYAGNVLGHNNWMIEAYDGTGGLPVPVSALYMTEFPSFSWNVSQQGSVSVLWSAPEPSTWTMLALGFVGLGVAGLRAGRAKVAA